MSFKTHSYIKIEQIASYHIKNFTLFLSENWGLFGCHIFIYVIADTQSSSPFFSVLDEIWTPIIVTETAIFLFSNLDSGCCYFSSTIVPSIQTFCSFLSATFLP